MKSNRELRADARNLMKAGWFARIVCVGFLLNAVAQLATNLVNYGFEHYQIATWSEFAKRKVSALQEGLNYTVPSTQVGLNMTGASTFELFILYIFTAIVTFGLAIVALKAVKKDETRWLGDSFDGFKRPLSLGWFLFVMNLRVFLWSLLFFIPGLIAVYRYRAAWYLKAEHPEYGASECLAKSGELMKGHKMQAFALDMSYWLWFLIIWVGFGVSVGMFAGGLSLIGGFFSLLTIILTIWVACYYFLARTCFYKELKSE